MTGIYDRGGLSYNGSLKRCIDIDEAKGWASLFTFERPSDETYPCVNTKVPIDEAKQWLAGEDIHPLAYGHPMAEPRQGDRVRASLTIRVGASNGDFRTISVLDHLDRVIAAGSIPYSALREIREEAAST